MSWMPLDPPRVGDPVYVRDDSYAWLPARVLQIRNPDHHQVLVRVDLPANWDRTTVVFPKDINTDTESHLDGREVWIDLTSYTNHQLPRRNADNVVARDMAELQFLHEAAVLYQIKARHASQRPYTRVGDIVVAVNPYTWIEGLYDPAQ
jgi:myosin-5